jgi:uncharacterized protein (TIGR03067 family)
MWEFMLLAFLATPTVASPGAGEVAAELQGTWNLELLDGKKDEKINAVSSLKVDADKGSFQHTVFKSRRRGVLKTDPAKNPKWIDFDIQEGPNKGTTQKGIYQIKDGKLTICFAKPGDERPGEFKADKDKGHQIEVWEKAPPQ